MKGFPILESLNVPCLRSKRLHNRWLPSQIQSLRTVDLTAKVENISVVRVKCKRNAGYGQCESSDRSCPLLGHEASVPELGRVCFPPAPS